MRVDLNQRSLKLSLTVHKRRSVGTEAAPFLVAWSLSQSTYGIYIYICTSCTVRVAALPFAPPMWTVTICSDHTRKFRDVSATKKLYDLPRDSYEAHTTKHAGLKRTFTYKVCNYGSEPMKKIELNKWDSHEASLSIHSKEHRFDVDPNWWLPRRCHIGNWLHTSQQM